MIPAPGRVLLRPIETESSIGRIQLLDSTRENMTPNQYEVVAVGPLVRCDDPDCERKHVKEPSLDHCLTGHGTSYGHPCYAFRNDWVLVRHRAVAPTDNDGLLIAWQDDILAILSLRSDPR